MAIDSRPRSSVTPSGSTTAFVSAAAMRKTCSLSAGSRLPTRRFGNGVARLVRCMHDACGAGGVGWATRGISMSCS